MLSGSVNEMERKEILEKLKTTEAEIRENVEAAQHKRNEILAQTQKQARKIEDDGERRIKTERENPLKKATADAEAQKKKAQIKKAKEFFVKKFEEYVHV
jgi:vacuolar-type H+-ATPase subunit H